MYYIGPFTDVLLAMRRPASYNGNYVYNCLVSIAIRPWWENEKCWRKINKIYRYWWNNPWFRRITRARTTPVRTNAVEDRNVFWIVKRNLPCTEIKTIFRRSRYQPWETSQNSTPSHSGTSPFAIFFFFLYNFRIYTVSILYDLRQPLAVQLVCYATTCVRTTNAA